MGGEEGRLGRGEESGIWRREVGREGMGGEE